MSAVRCTKIKILKKTLKMKFPNGTYILACEMEGG